MNISKNNFGAPAPATILAGRGVVKESALDRFSAINRLRLANLRTPIERADRLSRLIPGAPQLYIKRDDLTGYFGGGNKLRKLEYTMADAQARGATTVITTGSVTSNLARTAALVARRLGLKCVLVLNGGDPKEARANARIAELLGVEVHAVTTRAERDQKMDELAATLSRRGELVYKIPLGASNAVGSFGMVAAMEEIGLQQLELAEQFDAVVFATSSGGTQAGLEAGKRLFGYDNLRILGISADDPADSIGESVRRALDPMLVRLGLPNRAEHEELLIDDRFVGPGYGVASAESAEASRLFAEVEGVLLDPVYTSKAAAGLIAYCRAGVFKSTDRVLFWHTGGLMTLL
ncbi:MAG: D-cysteine desulfhydrase family protein [Pyrinomonadaceae bacterium]|nr:D-cysteine desulfhydrase family protein [Pyrinomonadaceae bacterium]